MVHKQPIPDENQDYLFEVDPVKEQFQSHAAQAGSAEPQVEMRTADLADRRRRAGLMLVTLSHLSNGRESQGYVMWDSTEQGNAEFNQRFRGAATTVRNEKEYQIVAAAHKARDAFSEAYKLGRSDHAPELEEHELEDAYNAFHFKFGSPKNPEAPKNRAKFRRQLRRTIKDMVGEPVPADSYEAVGESNTGRTPEEELELLSSRNRLIALRDDPRANFLPTNHREKTQAFTLLSYLDQKEYPGGVHQHLYEVSRHQINVFRNKGATISEAKAEGKRAVMSILHEYGDHAANALSSIVNLQKAQAVLNNTPNPAITLAEALDDNPDIEAGFNELIRYLDLSKFRDTGVAEMPFDPLGPKRNENVAVLRDGQNKRLDDPYTGDVRREEAVDYVDDQLQRMRVVTARKTIAEAISNEARSYHFWAGILLGIRYTYKDDARKVLEDVQSTPAA